MNKKAFLWALMDGLSGLPMEDIERSLDYYSEMIDDRMEDGLSEEEAVAAMGPVKEICAQIRKQYGEAPLQASLPYPPAPPQDRENRAPPAWWPSVFRFGRWEVPAP